MPKENNPNPTPSPFEIVTPSKSKKIGNKGFLIAGLIVVFLILSIVAGVLLVRQQQNIAEQAAVACTPKCPDSGGIVLRDCTSAGEVASRCSAATGRNGGSEKCGPAGGPKFCYICHVGSTPAWTKTDMSNCATPTPTPTPKCNSNCTTNNQCPTGLSCSSGKCRRAACSTVANCVCPTAPPAASATPTPTGTAAATPTPTGTAAATPTPTIASTPTPVATPRPIPETGTDWPTIAGMGIGAAAIIISILLAI